MRTDEPVFLEMSRNGPEMGRFSVEIELTNHRDAILASADALPQEKVRRLRIQGVVDSGATRLVLPAATVKALGLPTTAEATVRYADQRVAKRKLAGDVQLQLLGRQGVFSAVVEPKRTTALIGAIVMEELDLIVDCAKEALRPRDPKGIVSEIE